MPNRVTSFAVATTVAIYGGGCYSSKLTVKSPHLDGEYRCVGWLDTDDSNQSGWPPFEGPVAVLGGGGTDCSDLHDPEVRRLSATPSSDSRGSGSMSYSAGFLHSIQESKMLENLGFSIAAIIIAYAFGAATGPALWKWMKSRGEKW